MYWYFICRNERSGKNVFLFWTIQNTHPGSDWSFRYGNGNSFHSQELNLSFHERINKYDYNSPIRVIKECIENDISSTPTIGYRPLLLQKIKTELLSSRLNKFNDFKDNFNGLGISTHDISAQKISLLNFQKYPMGWSATIHFIAQDHFDWYKKQDLQQV